MNDGPVESAQTDAARAFFADQPLGRQAFDRITDMLQDQGPIEVRVSKSQVAFRRSRGFAYLWLPGMYLKAPGSEVVLSIALRRRIDSQRWKQVVEPHPGWWMHHLEIHDVTDVDDEVDGWLVEAATAAN